MTLIKYHAFCFQNKLDQVLVDRKQIWTENLWHIGASEIDCEQDIVLLHNAKIEVFNIQSATRKDLLSSVQNVKQMLNYEFGLR